MQDLTSLEHTILKLLFHRPVFDRVSTSMLITEYRKAADGDQMVTTVSDLVEAAQFLIDKKLVSVEEAPALDSVSIQPIQFLSITNQGRCTISPFAQLLQKYIAHVSEFEGTDFIDYLGEYNGSPDSGVTLTEEELAALRFLGGRDD